MKKLIVLLAQIHRALQDAAFYRRYILIEEQP